MIEELGLSLVLIATHTAAMVLGFLVALSVLIIREAKEEHRYQKILKGPPVVGPPIGKPRSQGKDRG